MTINKSNLDFKDFFEFATAHFGHSFQHFVSVHKALFHELLSDEGSRLEFNIVGETFNQIVDYFLAGLFLLSLSLDLLLFCII